MLRFLLIAVTVLCGPTSCTSPAGAQTEPAVAYAGLLAGDADRVRFSLDFDRKIAVQIRYSLEPLRVVVALPPTAFRLGTQPDTDISPLVGSISFDQSDAEVSRAILDLDGPVRVVRRTMEPIGSSDRYRLIIDFARAPMGEFEQLALTSPVMTPRVAEVPDAPPAKRPLIMIDPGHGGIDGGAQGRGRTSEKNVTLTFSKVFRDALSESGLFRVALTRTTDRFMTLEDRVAKAREAKAALFISVHADSLRQRRIRGATVYTLSDRASDEVSHALATDQNRADLAAGLSAPKLNTGAADILLDLMQRETNETSAEAAERIVKVLGSATRLIGNPNRSADFFVLRSPDVPSVLLELGYLSNRADEALLSSKAWQDKVAAALTNALVTLFTAKRAAAR